MVDEDDKKPARQNMLVSRHLPATLWKLAFAGCAAAAVLRRKVQHLRHLGNGRHSLRLTSQDPSWCACAYKRAWAVQIAVDYPLRAAHDDTFSQIGQCNAIMPAGAESSANPAMHIAEDA